MSAILKEVPAPSGPDEAAVFSVPAAAVVRLVDAVDAIRDCKRAELAPRPLRTFPQYFDGDGRPVPF